MIAEYPITVYEDPKTRERIVLNAKNEIIASVPAAKDYDPQWYVKETFPTAETAIEAALTTGRRKVDVGY